MKPKFYFLLSFLLLAFSLQAQVSKYTLSNCMIPYDNAFLNNNVLDNVILYNTAGGIAEYTLYNGTTTGSTADSLSGAGFSIGFPFLFDGQYFDRFAISTNFYVKLGKSSEGNFSILNEQTKGSVFQDGNNQLRRNTISTFERTMADDTIKKVYRLVYKLSGTPGNRNLQITWKCTRSPGPIGRYIYLRLLEKTGTILLTYGMDTLVYAKVTGSYPNYVYTYGELPLMQAAVGLRGSQLSNDTNNLNIMKVTKGVNTWTTFTRGTLATDLCDIDQHLLPLRNDDNNGVTPYSLCTYWYKWTPPISVLSKPACPYSYFIFRDTAYLNNNGYHYEKIPVDDASGNTYGFINKYDETYVFANGAKSIPINDTLRWNKSIGVDSFDVYFGLTYPPVLVRKNITDTIYTPTETLLPSTTYYYSIVAKNTNGNSDKCIGSFTTNALAITSCTPTSTYFCDDYDFSFNTLVYKSDTKYASTFLVPESAYTTSVRRGKTYTYADTVYISKFPNPTTTWLYVYIDWNQDGYFTGSNEKYSPGSITIPTNAKLGKTSLRNYWRDVDAHSADNPCGMVGGEPKQQFVITILPSDTCSSFVLNYTKTKTICYGDSTGTITLTPTGGTKPYACKWTDGDTSLVRTGLPAGTYQATVTDSAGCDQTVKLGVLSPFLIQIDTATVSDSLTITVSGGTGNAYTYTWTKNDTVVSNSTTISIPTSGTYSLTITDSVGCTVTYNNIVVPVKKANAVAIVKSAGKNLMVYPNPTGGDITVTSTNIIEKVVIMDVSGKTLKSKSNINSNEIKMKIGGFSEGAYFIKAYTVNGIETGQIIKK